MVGCGGTDIDRFQSLERLDGRGEVGLLLDVAAIGVDHSILERVPVQNAHHHDGSRVAFLVVLFSVCWIRSIVRRCRRREEVVHCGASAQVVGVAQEQTAWGQAGVCLWRQ